MKVIFGMSLGSNESRFGFRVVFGVGNLDGCKPGLLATIEQKLELPSGCIADRPDLNPYTPGEHVKMAKYANAANHHTFYKQIIDEGLPAALMLEDDFSPLPGFLDGVSKAFASLNEHRGHDGWDLLYLHWYDTTVGGPDLEENGELNGLPFRRAGCFGSTASYVVSSLGAKRLIAMKDTLFCGGFIGIDDYLMSLAGKGCKEAWAPAAVYFANQAGVAAPYQVLDAYATRVHQGKQTNSFGQLSEDPNVAIC